MKTRWILLISLLSLALGGCNASNQPKLTPTPGEIPLNPQGGSTQESHVDATTVPADENKLVDLAKQDLATRLKTDLSQITLLKTLEIKSADISKGCSLGAGSIISQGSQIYGYRIWLKTAGEEFIYHVGINEQIILCPKISPGSNNPLLTTPINSTQDPQNQSP